MRPLRYLYILSLVLWLGGMAIAGLVVAPTTFGELEAWNPATGRVLAGRVFGAVLARVHLIAYAAAAVMLITLTAQRFLGPRPKSYGVRIALLSLMFAVTAYSGLIVAPQIDRVQAEVTGPMNQLPAADPRRVEFDGLHRLSTALVGLSLAGGLVLLGWESRE